MPPASTQVMVEISAGELVDKVTILEIKAERIAAPGQRGNVLAQLQTLQQSLAPVLARHAELPRLKSELLAVNAALWQIEDDIRECERKRDFGPRFIELARAVYHNNDRRGTIKRQIDDLTGSRLVEEKSYAAY